MSHEYPQSWRAGLGLILFVTALIYLVEAFRPSALLAFIYSSLAGFLLAAALWVVRWGNRIAALLLIVAGTLIFWHHAPEWETMVLSLGRNLNLLTLFLLVPYFGIIMSVGGYLTALKHYIQHYEKQHKPHPYRLSTLLTAGMGVILNLGALPITYRIAEESFSGFTRKKMGMVLLRAFGFCMLWSPYFVNVGLVLVLFDVSWTSIAASGLIMAVVYMIMDFIFFRRLHFDHDQPVYRQRQPAPDNSHSGRTIAALSCWMLALLSLSFTLDILLEVSMLTIVSVLALTFPLFWALAIGSVREYIQTIVQDVCHAFDRLRNELAIFISAGYFGVSLSYTDLGDSVSQLILALSFESVYMMSVIIIVLTVLLALAGVHPVIVVIGIGSALKPELFGTSPGFMAVLLVTAWTLATQLSPFSGSVLMTAGLTGVSPWLIVKKNALFVLALIVVLPFILYLLWQMNLV
ncbi:hypothetical protein CathTA2_0466 [Caldalkalibacillus thermarum TA2.A1]|uniref:Uncharacterized protein n=1 Tax=Caldalkalibacillus thermarum (strain TA2.A1) TaxID=986075 RepID=F5L3V4_CALTT|nr:hypothetical protein [Caldalkalibacillus thermarum]EGL83980.1 hypothetical protein CathTA2_0466 [Caldalkalibacillus thermarum TA2.A1]